MKNWIISAETMRQCEERNFSMHTAEPLELMRIAGTGCAEVLLDFLHSTRSCRRIVIFSGHGNNGGDGIVIASILAARQLLPVVLVLAAPEEKLSAGSRHFFARLPEQVIRRTPEEVQLGPGDLIVDALLGTGCRPPLREPYRQLIDLINQARGKVFSVDIPSGLGTERCVEADLTVTIGYFKDLLFTAEGIQHCGLLRKVPLPLPIEPENGNDDLLAADREWFCSTSEKLPRCSHKYQRGKVLIAGGSSEYFQAPFLSARSALRSGAGLVQLGVPFVPEKGVGTLSVIPTQLPDQAGFLNAESFFALQKYLPKTRVVAAGPGMGRADSVREFLRLLLQIEQPLLLDADALFAAAQLPEVLASRRGATVLTPHRGEAAYLAEAFNLRLTGDDAADACALAAASGATVLLKGARTVVADAAGKVFLNTSGTPALATAGSGDVLSGLIAAEMLDHPPHLAAARGAFLHGIAGEMAEVEFGSRGVIADDLPEFIARARCRLTAGSDIF